MLHVGRFMLGFRNDFFSKEQSVQAQLTRFLHLALHPPMCAMNTQDLTSPELLGALSAVTSRHWHFALTQPEHCGI